MVKSQMTMVSKWQGLLRLVPGNLPHLKRIDLAAGCPNEPDKGSKQTMSRENIHRRISYT